MSQQQTARQWRILAFLSQRRTGITAHALADALGIHWRTLYRDLENLSASSFPIGQAHRNGTTFYSWTGPTLHEAVSLSEQEWLAVGLGAAVLAERGMKTQAETLSSLARRVCARPQHAEVPFGRVCEVVQAYPALETSTVPHGILATIVRAGALNLTVRMRYRSRANAEACERRVDPLAVFHKGEDGYMAAFCHQRRKVRTFKLSRVEWACAETSRFEKPCGFTLEGYLAGSFGVFRGGTMAHVRLRFAPRVATDVREHAWPPGTALHSLTRGYLEAVLDVVISEELERWLMSFGADVQVLEPEVLRARLEQRLGDALDAAKRARGAPSGQLRLFSLSARDRGGE